MGTSGIVALTSAIAAVSAEMLDAVKSLWDFYRLHGDSNLIAEYEKTRAADDAKLATTPPAERIELIATTLHYKRRLVSLFYLHLASLYANKILPKKVLYATWTRGDLAIIPAVLLPLEAALGRALGTGTPRQLMARLYADAPPDPTQVPRVNGR